MDETGYHVKPDLGIQMSYILPQYNVDHTFLHNTTYHLGWEVMWRKTRREEREREDN